MRNTAVIFVLAGFILCSAKPLAAEYVLPFTSASAPDGPTFQYADAKIWSYLRIGLNYLESPQPLAQPEAVAPAYVHPDGRGFGAYGLSPEAYEDIRRLYPYFERYSWEDILRSSRLYDLANQAFCDWLLKNLQDYIPAKATKQEIFTVVHQAWNLGLSGFKQGRKVVASRSRRAGEFLALTDASL